MVKTKRRIEVACWPLHRAMRLGGGQQSCHVMILRLYTSTVSKERVFKINEDTNLCILGGSKASFHSDIAEGLQRPPRTNSDHKPEWELSQGPITMMVSDCQLVGP